MPVTHRHAPFFKTIISSTSSRAESLWVINTVARSAVRKGLLQNFTILRYFGLPVRYHAVCMMAR